MIRDIIITIMELVGTVSFAVSGALVAIGCSLDIFGVVTVGCITAVGGGIIRDVIIGNIPPRIFSNPHILLIAVVTSLAVFIVAYVHREKFKKIRSKAEMINVLFDALGLASFSITGVECVLNSEFGDNALLAVTLGVMTGIGGGVLRDVLVNEKPYILVRHVYAVVSILGCVFYYLIGEVMGHEVAATFFVLVFVLITRVLAAKYHWRLPKITFDENGNATQK